MPMSIFTLLVVDDEPNIVFSLKETLSSPTLKVISAGTAREGIDLVKQKRPDVVMLDVRLPDQSGLDAYDKIRQIDPRLPVIIMTAFARTETAIEAMRRGAYEYLVKPVDFKRLKEVLAKALEVSRLSRVPAVLAETDPDDLAADRIIGLSPVMQEVYKDIGRIAPQDSTVLILGESGTGKELVARALYHYSKRSQQPFLAINCAALPETILESELFGHERGAFTGADQRRIGKFEQVNGGTIFLDEIGDMSPATQAKALRLLQEQQFERIGGNATVKTDVRIIAATNRDLNKDVAEGRFRQDLLYRLNGFTIQLPPLRDRRDDIPLLLEHFLRLFNVEMNKTVASASPDAIQLLQQHDWPGNIREFQSAIKYAMVHTTGATLTPDSLPQSCLAVRTHSALPLDLPEEAGLLGTDAATGRGGEADVPSNTTSSFDLVREVRRLLQENQPDLYRHIGHEIDRILLQEVMSFVSGNQVQAAERLGISRMTLRSKLRLLGLISERQSEPDDTL
ncbi:MAG: sigma-54-dependent Fis family transcriptional regulator [Planctomycetota bacterium]|nr:MAG: sigma-54-dependent Fis family transcriptional regulator [Planctomycetota bacterium]